MQDVRYALRLFRRNPLFTLTAVLSLAIGIGANTAVFTVASALLFRGPAGVVDAGRVVDIGRSQDGQGFDTNSYPNYLDVRARSTVFSSVYAYDFDVDPVSLGGPGGAERVFGNTITTNYFDTLGTRPVVGRLFSGSEGDAQNVVLSHGLWTRRFGGDRSIVGRAVQLNGQTFTVIGVAEEGFQGTTIFSPDLWTPMRAGPRLTDRGAAWLMMGGRLKPGLSVEKAQAELAAIGVALQREFPRENEGRGLRVQPLSLIPGNSAPVVAFISLLTGIVAMVLIVACANVAGVLLARATTRRREMAVRIALGAGRSRLIRQLLVETAVLFLGAAAIGLVLAKVMMSLLMAVFPALPVQVNLTLQLDAPALLWTLGVALFAAVLSGLAPAFYASRRDVVTALKQDSQSSPERMRLRNAFVIAQVALSLVLVAGAGLFLRALQKANAIDPGFDPRGAEMANLDLSLAGYTPETGPLFARQLVERLRATPGIADASIAAVLPLNMGGMGVGALTLPGSRDEIAADWNMIETGYFSTLRTPLLRGRDFNERDDLRAPFVAIVNETLARRVWPNEDPIGKTLVQTDEGVKRTLTIVGVAHDAKYRSLGEDPRNYVHLPLAQQYRSRLTLVVRSTNGQSRLADVRRIVASMNPNLPIVSAQSLQAHSGIALFPQRIAAAVTGVLGSLGLLLAAIGIYGVTAYVVSSRTREIGIRMALGAQRSDVTSLVLRQGMRLVFTGAVIGSLIAAAASRVAASMLFGVGPADPIVFIGTAVLFCAVGAMACWVPLRRATGIDAWLALRAE